MSDETGGRETGDGGTGGPGTGDQTGFAGGSPDAGELLGQVRAVRRRTRLARHAYWFPLVLFGLLTFASIPFYLRQPTARPVTYYFPGARFLGNLGGLGAPDTRFGLAYYWLAALIVGVAVTAAWYRWRGDRVGLRTPARGYLIAGLLLVALALLIPVLPGDLVIRGTFPFVLIALGLGVLAWAERSVALTVIAVCYLGFALVASLYDIVNLFYRAGWILSPSASLLPNVVIPGLVLLVCGAGAWLVQRRYGRPPATAATSGVSQ